jgi:hypothetical protein
MKVGFSAARGRSNVAQASKPAVSQVSKPAECPFGIAAHASKRTSDSARNCISHGITGFAI